MPSSTLTLTSTALTIAVVHTAIGVDHYLPFVALGRAQGWSLRKTLLWTSICGAGHILSSVVLAVLAASLGWVLGSVRAFDATRGDIVAYLLLAFGLGYLVWGVGRVRHAHRHSHGDGHSHDHPHSHGAEIAHDASATHHHARPHATTLWALFIIFVLGPCEPLIPLLVAPAVTHDLTTAVLVVVAFGAATIATMVALVTAGYLGAGLLRFGLLERWAHPLAGLAIVVSGALILIGL